MSLADLLFDLPLVIKEGFQGLIKVFFDEILHQLIIHANDSHEQRYWEGIQLWRVEFKDDLGQKLRRDVSGSLGVSDSNIIALLNQRADFLEGQVAAVSRIVIAAIGVLLNFKNLVSRVLRHIEIVDFAPAQRK